MAVYDKEQGFRSILNAALGEYQSKGFRLEEISDCSLMLYYQDEAVGVLGPNGYAIHFIPAIHDACREHLESISAS